MRQLFMNTRTQNQCDTGESGDSKNGRIECPCEIDKQAKDHWHKQGSDVSKRRDETNHSAD